MYIYYIFIHQSSMDNITVAQNLVTRLQLQHSLLISKVITTSLGNFNISYSHNLMQMPMVPMVVLKKRDGTNKQVISISSSSFCVSCLYIFSNLSSTNWLLRNASIHLTHSPVRFAKALQGIKQPHKDAIEAMGLGGCFICQRHVSGET